MAGCSGTYPRSAIDPVPTRSCSNVSLRVPFGRGRDDAARVVRPSLIRGPRRSIHRSDLETSRSGPWMLRLARRPCRVASFVLRRNTPPGGLVGADLHGREAAWSFPSGDDTSVRSRLIQCRARRLPPGRFELSDGSCCNYTSLHRSPCGDPGVHDVAMHLQSTACTGSCVHSVGQWCEYRWKRVPLWSLRWFSADSCCNHVSPTRARDSFG